MMIGLKWLLVILLIFSGCSLQEEAPKEVLPAGPGSPEEVPRAVLPFTRGEDLARYVGTLAREGDPEDLLLLADQSWPGYFDTEAMAAAVADYRTILGTAPVVAVTAAGAVPYAEALHRYELATGAGRSLILTLKEEGGQYFLADFVTYYSGFKNRLMDRYLKALRQEDPAEIARAVYLDETGETYPEAAAVNLLHRYREAFDLETLAWEFTGETGSGGEFAIRMTGMKEGTPVIHDIRVVTGDGQVGLRDPWAE